MHERISGQQMFEAFMGTEMKGIVERLSKNQRMHMNHR